MNNNENFLSRMRLTNQTYIIKTLLDASDKGFEEGPSTHNVLNLYPVLSGKELEELKEQYPQFWDEFKTLDIETQSQYRRGFYGFVRSRGGTAKQPSDYTPIQEWYLIDPIWSPLFLSEGEAILRWANQHWWGRRLANQTISHDLAIERIRKRVDG